MSLLVLREVDAKAARDAALLRLFELCRGHVEHVAATPHVPHCVALATRGGFVQLVDLVSGEYRLFLTHLGHVPLDSALRCFALVVPPSSSSSSRDGGSARRAVWPRQVLLYSLASSNELLLADVDSGVVAVLAACRTRPSVAMCDAHYLIAGEGGGEVTVWRAEHDDVKGNMHNNNNDDKDDGNNNATPHLVHAPLWCRAVVDDTVTCLSRCTRDCLVCCSAACECVVVAVDSGVLLATLQSLSLSSLSSSSLLLPFASPVVAVLPRGDADDASRVVVCTATELRLLATAHKDDDNDTSTSNSNSGKEDGDDAVAVSTTDEVTAGQRRRLPSSSLSWRCVSTTHVDVAMQCVTCSRAYVVAGTASGVVLLFRCDGAHDAVVELVRFDVGFAVVSVQLYESDEKDDSDSDDDDAHLLVVTSAGDVWRWPLRTLVAAAAATTTNTNDDVDDAVTDDEGNDDDTSTTTTAETDTTMPHEDNAQTQQQQETEDDNDDDDAYEPRPHAQLPQPTAADTPTAAAVVDDKVAVHATRAHGGAAATSSPVDETADDAVVVVMADDDDDDDDKDAVMTLASLPPRQRHDDDDDDDAVKQPRCDEDTRRSNNAAALATASEAANTTPPPPPPPTTMATMTSPRQLVEAAAAAQVTRALGPRIPAQTAAQLRRGRRMSRQMVTSLLANACDDDDDDDDSSGSNSSSGSSSSSGDDDADAAVQLNSTLLLRAQYAALQRATFVPSRDVDATALDVQALQYRHPVVLPSYSPRARLYDAVPPLLTTTTMTAAAAPAAALAAVEQTSSATTSASPSPPATVAVAVHDDLMDATCLRRPHKRSVSRNAHKDDKQLAHTMLHIEEHGCDALLYGTLAHGTHATMTTTRAAAATAVSLLLRDDGDDDDDRDVAMSLQPDVPPLLLLPLPLPSSPAVF